MTISFQKLHADFCVEVTGVDLTRPLDQPAVAEITKAFNEQAVLVFHDQPVDDDQQIVFSQNFGPLEGSLAKSLGGSAAISNLSNTDGDTGTFAADDARTLYLSGNQRWHSDSSFKPVGATASLLSAREIPPEGGETEYADMRAAYDALDDAMKERLEGLEAEHSFEYSQGQISLDAMTETEIAAVPPVRHPMVRIHPITGHKALYVGRHASHVIGMPLDAGRALIEELIHHATQPKFVYSHSWRVGDLVMWDNRSVVHRGRPYDGDKYRRVMHRTTVTEDVESNPWLIAKIAGAAGQS